MNRKLFALLLASALVFSASACGSSADETASQDESGEAVSGAEAQDAPDGEAPDQENPDAQNPEDAAEVEPVNDVPPGFEQQPPVWYREDGAASAGEEMPSLADSLTPEGATVVSAEEGALSLQSDAPLTVLSSFYRDMLEELGAVQDTLEEADGWHYAGTLPDETAVTVDISGSEEDGFEISITW